jgi:hypothetical protein
VEDSLIGDQEDIALSGDLSGAEVGANVSGAPKAAEIFDVHGIIEKLAAEFEEAFLVVIGTVFATFVVEFVGRNVGECVIDAEMFSGCERDDVGERGYV